MPSLKQILSNKNLFLFGLVLIIVGMPLSKFLMSLGQFVLLGNWFIEGDFKRKWQLMKTSRVLWVMSSFYILHLVGLFWTSDFAYASNDLRVKLPLLWFPLLFITSKQTVDKKEIQNLLWLFTSSVFVASIVCTFVWLGFTKHKVVDIRDISIFNSHIRFALMIDLTICFLLYDFMKSGKWFLYLLKVGLIVWLIVFLGIMQSFTGIMVLVGLLFYFAFKYVKETTSKKTKVLAGMIFMLIVVFGFYSIYSEVKSLNVSTKPFKVLETTKNGNKYYNNISSPETENGNKIWINICTHELTGEWEKRSKISFEGEDKKGNKIASTLIRYMASKGLDKDSVGLSKLSAEDVGLIENGTTNYLYTNKTGIENRIHEIVYEYDSYKRGKDPTGHSLLMRLEFWRVGRDVFKSAPICGVGTGDAKNAYLEQYAVSKSQLSREWRLRSHNQFLAIAIAFGIVGLVVFLLYLFYPAMAIKQRHYLFPGFLIISLLSMINEDTLETQAGVTFFGFFYCFLLFNGNTKSKEEQEVLIEN